MENKVCHIICAGENKGNSFIKKEGELLIVADGGWNNYTGIIQSVDLLVGDFDSINDLPTGCKIIKLKREKDQTDSMVCIEQALSRGYNEIRLYCGTGGRIDHTIANMQCLISISRAGKVGYLFDGKQIITAVCENQVVTFSSRASGIISIFSASDEARGVTLRGLKYQIANENLTNAFPLGVSNEFIHEKCEISLKNGVLFIVFPIECISEISWRNIGE